MRSPGRWSHRAVARIWPQWPVVEGIVPMRPIKIGALRPELRIFFSWSVHYGALHVPGSIEKTKQVENYSAAIKDLLRNNSHIFAGRGWCAAVSPKYFRSISFRWRQPDRCSTEDFLWTFTLFTVAGTAAQRVALRGIQPPKSTKYPVTDSSDATFRLPDF